MSDKDDIDLTQKCVDHLMELVKSSLPTGQGDTVYVYDEEIFTDATKELEYPAVGVIYTGTQGKQSAPGRGMSAEMQFVLIFMFEEARFDKSGRADKSKATNLLRSIRNTVKSERSPSGHMWRFLMEAPRGTVDKHMVYYQKWALDVILT